MSLTQELITILDNDDEPLPKRLKIADNVFKSTHVAIQSREVFLLKWVLKEGKYNVKQTWDVVYNWLNSEQFTRLNRNDFGSEDIEILLENINHVFKNASLLHNEVLDVIFNCITILFAHQVIEQYFKSNLNKYCNVVGSVLDNFGTEKHILEFLRNENVFNKSIISEEKFYKHFMDGLLFKLNKVCLNHQNDQILVEVCKVVQKSVFARHFKVFNGFFEQLFNNTESEEKFAIPKALIKVLSSANHLETPELENLYQTTFKAFCNAYHDFGVVYKFFIIIVDSLGFEVDFNLKKISKYRKNNVDLETSIGVITKVLEVLTTNNVILDYKVNEKTFTQFLVDILNSLMNLSKVPSTNCYKIFLLAIKINPLIAETILSDFIPYIMLGSKDHMKDDYPTLLKTTFEVFAKLHRIQNLISKMIPALKSSLDNEPDYKEVFTFRGENNLIKMERKASLAIDVVFPNEVLDFFTNCITTMASWQVINLCKTLLFHLNSVLDEVPKNDSQIFYIETLGKLLTRMLCSVRIAEHTISDGVVEKFVKCMLELRDILGKFGLMLLNIEHNQKLVACFLTISFEWAEIFTTLEYYSLNKEVTLSKSIDSDFAACNLTYLHSYLNADQWCLLSERITNFVEKKWACHKLMQKLIVQKLKTMILFEDSLNEEYVGPVVNYICFNINASKKENQSLITDIISDKFVVTFFLPRFELGTISIICNALLEQLNNDDYRQKNVFDSELTLNLLTYNVLMKIKKTITENSKKPRSKTLKMFDLLNESHFTLNADLSEMVMVFKNVLENTDVENVDVLNIEKVKQYLDVLSKIPVIFLSNDIQKVVLFFLFTLQKDFRKCLADQQVQNLILGIIQQSKWTLINLLNSEFLLELIVDNFEMTETLLTSTVENIFKSEESIKKFQEGVIFLGENVKNSKYLELIAVVLNNLTKMKKSKFSKETKALCITYKDLLINKVTKRILKEKPSQELLQPFTYSLKHFLQQENCETTTKITDKVTDYIEFSMSLDVLTKGSIFLFTLILHNKLKLKNIPEDFTLKVWNFCKDKSFSENEEYSQLVVLIFEHVSNEGFTELCENLLEFTEKSMVSKNKEGFLDYLKLWTCVVPSSFNPVKTKVWQEILEKLLITLYLFTSNADYHKDIFDGIINFEMTIIHQHQLHLTPPMIDIFLLKTSTLIYKQQDFQYAFSQCVTFLESLLKHRNPLIMDRLPAYLQQFRILLRALCKQCNNPDKQENVEEIEKFSGCAHQLEKLTKQLVGNQKHMARISVYLIADILAEYEKNPLFPNVKIHLNNCIYSLISLCDQHSVSYLMRVLSNASTELFKIMFDNYKKYYRFTGKV